MGIVLIVSLIVIVLCGIGTIWFGIQSMQYSRLTMKILNKEPLTPREQKLRESLPSYKKGRE